MEHKTRHSSHARRPARPLVHARPWARAALLAAFIGMMLLLAVGLVAKIARPYREVRQQRQQLTASRAALNKINAENAALLQKIATLKTADGQITEARRLGYVRPGEVPFVVEDAASVPTSAERH